MMAPRIHSMTGRPSAGGGPRPRKTSMLYSYLLAHTQSTACKRKYSSKEVKKFKYSTRIR